MDLEHVAQRLELRFGLGSNPALRRALYQRLERITQEEGEPAYLVIATAAADALGKNDPGRYFAHVVMARLVERSILPAPEI